MFSSARSSILLVPLVAAAACADVATPLAAPPDASFTTSQMGVVPTAYPGNFVASDDVQVCYELNRLFAMGLTGDLRGFKVDLPGVNADGHVEVSISANGRQLAWSTSTAIVHGVIVKGGPSYNLYNYAGTGMRADAGLTSPRHGKNIPAISHYNVCYTPDPVEGDQGCTPGYWRNHADRWAGVAPSAGFDATFGVTSGLGGAYTLGQAIWTTGGGVAALARHATAGLLNAYGGVPNADGTTVAYAYSAAEVIAMVQDAIASGDPAQIESAKDALAAANEAGCPLSGTRAVPVN